VSASLTTSCRAQFLKETGIHEGVNTMAYTAENWPITAALLQFPGTDAQGNEVNDADASVWAEVFTEVRDAGFADADLTDSWVRPGDLSSARLAEFKQTADNVGIGIPVISAIRRS